MQNYYNSSFPIYSDARAQRRNYYQNTDFFNLYLYYPYFYPIQPYYQMSFHQPDKHSLAAFNQYEHYNTTLMRLYHSYSQYQSRYIWPYNNQMTNNYLKHPNPSTSFTNYLTTFANNPYQNSNYWFNKKMQFDQYSPFNRSQISDFITRRSLWYTNYRNRYPLPPKIRVIFIPPTSSCLQQPCNIAPSMPPFLFNRMSQPFCSLPLPPSLPHISSLPLNVQQMAMQRYANPVAVLPFTPNYQSAAQSFAPNYSLPPVVPQQPSLMPTPVAPPCAASLPQSAYFPGDASISQPSNGAYPNTGRAYVPAPPPLNIPVSNQYWVKHSSAHHQIPSYVSNLNFRPSNQSQTASLLRPLQGVQHGYDRNSNYRQQYPHVNSYPIRRPSSNNLPPLPPGAVIISDECIPKYSLAATQHYTQNNPLHQSRVGNSLSRANELTTYSHHKNRNGKEKIQEYDNKKSPTTEQVQKRYLSNMRTSPPHSYVPESYSSASLSTGSISKLSKSSLDTNTANYAPHKERQLVKKQMTALTRMVNLRYRHPSPDVHAIYNANEKAKSSDEDSRSIATSNTKTSLVLSEKNQNDNRSRSVSCDARSENHDKSIQNRPVAPFPFEKSQQRTSIAQNLKNASLMTTSVSSLDTISANIDTGRNSVSLVSITSNDTKK